MKFLVNDKLTEEEAKKLYKTEFWKDMPLEEVAELQLFTTRLVVPFDLFHKGMEVLLKRPVFTHEFAHADELRKEALGEKKAPTLKEIIELIPEEKRVVIIKKSDKK